MSEINIIENIDMDISIDKLINDPNILALWEYLKTFRCKYCNEIFKDFIICDDCQCVVNFCNDDNKDICRDCYLKSLCEFTFNIYKKYNKLYCKKCFKKKI